MKRKLTLGIFLAVLTTSLMAQDPMFSQGDKVLNLGIGFGSTLYSGSFYHTSVPALSASYEVGVKDGVLDVGSIGVGGYVGYSAFKSTYDYIEEHMAGKSPISLSVPVAYSTTPSSISSIPIPA